MVVRSLAMKEAKKNVLIKKRRIKGEKYITPMDLTEHLRKLDVSEVSKLYYGWFLRNRLYEMYYYISKHRWDVQYLEVY